MHSCEMYIVFKRVKYKFYSYFQSLLVLILVKKLFNRFFKELFNFNKLEKQVL